MEIALFKEVLNVNPFTVDGAEGLELWRQVGVNTGLALGLPDPILGRTCKTKTEKQVVFLLYSRQKKYQKVSKI